MNNEEDKKGYLGIDPGLSGGFVYIEDHKIRYKLAMPTITITKANEDEKKELDRHAISSFLSLIPAHMHAVIEQQHPARNQSIVAICTTCKNYGILLMALHSAHLYITEVTSDVWQDYYSIVSVKKAKGKTTKQQALEIVKKIYPHLDLLASKQSTKEHSGIVDAILICLWGKNQLERA